jgi:hypothetical protein
MLPRVESIHDNRWCLFFVTTNTWLEELDPAITREGRFDRKQLFFHPRPPGQLRYARARVASRLLATGASDAARAHAAKLLGQVLDRQYLADRQPWEELAETLKKLKDAEDTTAAINAADAASDRRWVTFGDLDWLAKQIADTTAALPDAEAEPESMTRLVNEIDSKLQDRLKIESRNVWFEFETPVRRPT